jgi:hypothetical protein
MGNPWANWFTWTLWNLTHVTDAGEPSRWHDASVAG